MIYLICYDITDNRRRTKVSKLLEAYGIRIQKSVFEATLTPPQFQTLTQKLQTTIDLNRDRLRFYPLSVRCRNQTLILGLQADFAIGDGAVIL
ncbi:MAG: CRISPR-associated endonuclease Cas2 [Cyanobacteria bacterium P01_E01_bin.42]